MATFRFRNRHGYLMSNNYFHRIARVTSFSSFGGFAKNLYIDCRQTAGYITAMGFPRTNVYSEFNTLLIGRQGQEQEDYYGDVAQGTFLKPYYVLYNPNFRNGLSVSVFARQRGNNLLPPYVKSSSYPKFTVSSFRGNTEYRTFDADAQNFGFNIINTYSKTLNATSFTDPTTHSSTFTLGTLTNNQLIIPLEGLFYKKQYINPQTPGLWMIETYIAVFQRRSNDELTFRYRLLYTAQGTKAMTLPPPPTKLSVVVIEDKVVPDFRVDGVENYKIVT